MKFFLTLGGSIGFLTIFFTELHAGNEIGFALRDGALGCLAGAFLLRGFHYVMMRCIKSLVLEQNSMSASSTSTKGSSSGVN
jgi:hypothetical protein